MPRYYRRRYTRVVKPKKKWATNIRKVFLDTQTIGVTRVGAAIVLCANSLETAGGQGHSAVVPTPTIIKTGNYKVQCDAHIGTNSSAVIRSMMYIMYLPEGVYAASTSSTVSEAYEQNFDALSLIVSRHPEWILAWRQFGSDLIGSSTNLDKVSFSSRLKRNLNSGDQIVAVVLANVDTDQIAGTPISRVIVNGTCQFWTCNN